MKRVIELVVFLIAVTGGGDFFLGARSDDWKEDRLSEIEAAKSLGWIERIESVAPLVRINKSYSWSGNDMSENQRIVHREAVKLMIQTPGHANYFAKQFEDDRKDALERYERFKEHLSGPDWTVYDYNREKGFEVLGQLPSPETVGVLGELLYDERDRQTQEMRIAKKEQDMGLRPDGNNIKAAKALTRLGIVSPPVYKRWNRIREQDVEAWRIWYEQVKAGIRTFRFEGDPQEYTLAGPADRARVPDTARAAKPTSLPAAVPPESDGDGSGSPLSLLALLVACSACAAGVWAVLKGKKGREA